MRIGVLTAVFTILPWHVFAAEGCFGNGTPLFHCTVKGGAKAVDVCLQSDVLIYRFGAPRGAAELLLAKRVENVRMQPWNGVGRSIWEELIVDNSGYSYNISYSIDRMIEDGADDHVAVPLGDVIIAKGAKILNVLKCDSGSVAVADFYPLFEAKEASGQCWSHGNSRWERC